MPPAGNSFLSAANRSGKLAAHFCTHAGSGLETSDRELRAQAPNAQFLESLSVVGTGVDLAKAQIENLVSACAKSPRFALGLCFISGRGFRQE